MSKFGNIFEELGREEEIRYVVDEVFYSNISDCCKNSIGNVWDVRAGKQMHKLTGHSSWIR